MPYGKCLWSKKSDWPFLGVHRQFYATQLTPQIDAEIVKPGTRAEGVGSPRKAFGQKGPFLDGNYLRTYFELDNLYKLTIRSQHVNMPVAGLVCLDDFGAVGSPAGRTDI